LNILIIDDEKSITDALTEFLKEANKVTCFNDPLEAWGHYKDNNCYDVVIMDFLMPHLRGDALIEKIFKLNPDQHFIVISGFFTKEFIDILKRSNAFIKMIDKPISPDDINSALETIKKLN